MRHFFATCVLWAGLALSARGVSVEHSVTTTNLDHYNYTFTISTNAVTNGVAFHITITAKQGDIPEDSGAGLSTVTHTKSSSSIMGVTPEIRITLRKGRRVWAADFTVAHELLEKPDVCFVFTEQAHAMIDGKSVPMPSADFYEIKLRDFLKR